MKSKCNNFQKGSEVKAKAFMGFRVLRLYIPMLEFWRKIIVVDVNIIFNHYNRFLNKTGGKSSVEWVTPGLFDSLKLLLPLVIKEERKPMKMAWG